MCAALSLSIWKLHEDSAYFSIFLVSCLMLTVKGNGLRTVIRGGSFVVDFKVTDGKLVKKLE